MKFEDNLLAYIQSRRSVSIKELTLHFATSAPTIRRYLEILKETGLIKKNHGSVEAIHQNSPSFSQRMNQGYDLKNKIAIKAASLVLEGETIFMGGGSTVANMCAHLIKHQKLTVITNSLYIANFLSNYPKITVISTGGLLLSKNAVFTGNFTQAAFEQFLVDKAFFGAEGIDVKLGIFKDIELEELNEQLMFSRSKQNIVLASSDKVGRQKPLKVASASDIDIIITDKELNSTYQEIFESNNIRVLKS